MKAIPNNKIPYEVFAFYPDVVRVVALKMFKRYVHPKKSANDYFEEIISDCYLYYLEIRHEAHDRLRSFDREREFSYLFDAIKKRWYTALSRRISRETAESSNQQLCIIKEENVYSPIEAQEQEQSQKLVYDFARGVLGEELDADNVAKFVTTIQDENTSLAHAIAASMEDVLRSIQDNVKANAQNYEIEADGKIIPKRNTGVHSNQHGEGFKRNPLSVRGHIREAIKEKGLYDINDIRAYLHQKGVFFNDESRNALSNQIGRAYKDLGLKRPARKSLKRTEKINSFIKECLTKGMSLKDTHKEIKKQLDSFDLPQFFDLYPHVSNFYCQRKYRAKQAKAIPLALIEPEQKKEIVMMGFFVAAKDYAVLKSLVKRDSVPLKTLLKKTFSQHLQSEPTLAQFKQKISLYAQETKLMLSARIVKNSVLVKTALDNFEAIRNVTGLEKGDAR